jgi:hypothetical protein
MLLQFYILSKLLGTQWLLKSGNELEYAIKILCQPSFLDAWQLQKKTMNYVMPVLYDFWVHRG